MASPNTPRNGREHGGVSPILIVAGIAVVAFVAALIAFSGGSSSKKTTVDASGQINVPTSAVSGAGAGAGAGCTGGAADAAYTVVMDSDPNPPRAEGTTFHLTVRHDGKAVTGAKVCMVADMTEMHHQGINSDAKEASGGKYDATLKFGMRGPYAASVVVVDAGKAVSVPITFQVD
ncbi:MAG: FixH family protein [Actinomycetota bacterium]|nr:FixH family protein [Actinomycetota bacterium]